MSDEDDASPRSKPEGESGVNGRFLVDAARQVLGIDQTAGLAVLDFGCGQGGLVQALVEQGLDARGCDLGRSLTTDERLDEILTDPYRLPYPDGSFDLVVSTSVFEHAQNTDVFMAEIHRVLRSGGAAMHVFPGKWYLPVEPHIYVPLVSWFWPRAMTPWLALWAMVGVRNEYQQGMSWREVTRLNAAYVRDGLCYRTAGRYESISDATFGNHEWPMRFYIENGPGGAASLARRLPFKWLTGRLLRELRFAFLVQRKA